MSAFESTVPETTATDPGGIASTGMKAVAGVLLAVLALTSCSSIPTARDLTGMWASSAVVTPRGSISESFCFAADGSVEWFAFGPGGTRTYRGTFKIVGNVLTIEAPDLETPATLKARMSLGKLELTSRSGSVQKYSRVPRSCDEKSG